MNLCINCKYFLNCDKASKEVKECNKFIRRGTNDNRRFNKF